MSSDLKVGVPSLMDFSSSILIFPCVAARERQLSDVIGEVANQV